MHRPITGLAALLIASGCAAGPHGPASKAPDTPTGEATVEPESKPGGSSPVMVVVIAGVVIAVILLISAAENSAAFLPDANP